MAISSSIIPSFSSSKPRGLISGARNFITGQKPGLESIIDNISSPHKSTSNFLTVFGSDKTEEILKKSVKTLRTTLLDVFELSRVLVVAIEEISKSLKNLSMNAGGSGGGLLGKLLKGLAIGGGIGTSSVIGKKLTRKVVQEGGEKVTTQVGKRLIQKTTPQATKGIVPKLTNFAKKNKWLAMLGLLGLPFMFTGDKESGVSSIDSGSIDKFSSQIDSFTVAVESLKQLNSKSVFNEKDETTTPHWSEVEPGSVEEKKLIEDGVKSLNESSAKHLEQNSHLYYEFPIGEVKKDDQGNWVLVEQPTINGDSNNNLKQIENLSVGANQSMINVIPYSGMPTQSGGGSGGNLNVPTSSGASSDLPFLSSGKSDSFATLESKMIYNIVE